MRPTLPVLAFAIAFVSWASPADASCAESIYGGFCSGSYAVAEVQELVGSRTRLVVVEGFGADAPAVGEVFTLNTAESDRRGDLIVVFQGSRLGELTDGRFNHFGASLTIDEVEALRAHPDTCVAELDRRGGQEPPACNDMSVGLSCAGAGGMTAFALLPLLFFQAIRPRRKTAPGRFLS